jgi:TPR repeat protein
MRGIVVVAVCWLALAPPVNAGPMEDAEAAFARNDYAAAIPLFRSLADKGDAAAEERLGDLYHSGWGVPQDRVTVAKWFMRAADHGSKSAERTLGFMMRFGTTWLDRQMLDEVVAWNRKAAERGDAVAQLYLGIMAQSVTGGVPKEYQSYTEAARWFRLAADQGLADAQLQLGIM